MRQKASASSACSRGRWTERKRRRRRWEVCVKDEKGEGVSCLRAYEISLHHLTLGLQVVQACQLRLQAVGCRVDHVVAVLWKGGAKEEKGA
jgi:hypothetical protein